MLELAVTHTLKETDTHNHTHTHTHTHTYLGCPKSDWDEAMCSALLTVPQINLCY